MKICKFNLAVFALAVALLGFSSRAAAPDVCQGVVVASDLQPRNPDGGAEPDPVPEC